MSQQEFHDFFKGHGNVRSAKVESNSDGKSRGFGFVLFENAESAQKVLALQKEQLMLGGKPFEVFLHQPKEKRNDTGASA